MAKRKRSQGFEAKVDDPKDVQSSKQPRRTNPFGPELSEELLQEDSVHHLEEAQELPPQPPLIHPSPDSPAPISQLVGTRWKRLQDSEADAEADELEDVRPFKQPRELSRSELPKEILLKEAEANEQELPPSKHRLSEKNLRLFNGDTDCTAKRPGNMKRVSSLRSTVTLSEAESSQSQHSSKTTAHYRYRHLVDANVYIHVDPPEDIQAAIDNIVNAEPSEDRYAILRNKAIEFWKTCKKMVQAAAGEGDFVHFLHTTAKEISPDQLIFCEKAEWRAELKPLIQQSDWNLSFLSDLNAIGHEVQREVDDASALPSPKRHQQSAGRLYISPRYTQTSLSDALPDNHPPQPDEAKETPPIKTPQPNKAKEKCPIKTPHPDITTGIEESALVSALVSSLWSHNFNYNKAKQFLQTLQNSTMPSEQDGRQEPALIVVPTERESTLTFPTLIFEAKGYSTGKQVFEAQNQAAVSGAGGLKIQLMLDELVKRATRSSDVPLTPSKNQPPLVFSICTEGPHHELWAHYTIIKDGERQYNMVLLDACHGVLLKQVERFLVRVYNVMTWTTGLFLKTVVERLGEVARKATA